MCREPDWEDYFEIQEFVNKESFVFKACATFKLGTELQHFFCWILILLTSHSSILLQGDDAEQTRLWFQTLQFYSQSLGGWRKRRKGLGNIMIDPNLISPGGGGEGPDAADASPEGAVGGD